MFWEPPVTRWEKSVLVRAGVPVPSARRAGRELLLLPARGGNQTEETWRGLGEREGQLCHPTGEEKGVPASHSTPRVPWPAGRRLLARGDGQRAGLCRGPRKPGEHCSLIIN